MGAVGRGSTASDHRVGGLATPFAAASLSTRGRIAADLITAYDRATA